MARNVSKLLYAGACLCMNKEMQFFSYKCQQFGTCNGRVQFKLITSLLNKVIITIMIATIATITIT